MKQRNGFVSNSSSSSFIIIGYKQNGPIEDIVKKIAPQKYAQIKERYKDDDAKYAMEDAIYDCMHSGMGIEGLTYLSDDGPGYLGKEVCKAEDWGIESSSWEMDDLMKAFKEVQETLGMDTSPMLYTGTRAT